MKKAVFPIIFVLILSCDSREIKSYYPANPPVDLEMILLDSGTYSGDYLLLFRSENSNNSRFGGFLTYIGSTQEIVMAMTEDDSIEEYTFGEAFNESSSTYNPSTGMDTQLAILFTDASASAGITISVDSTDYTITAVREKTYLNPGIWLAMSSYLWDDDNALILEVSDKGDAVLIP